MIVIEGVLNVVDRFPKMEPALDTAVLVSIRTVGIGSWLVGHNAREHRKVERLTPCEVGLPRAGNDDDGPGRTGAGRKPTCRKPPLALKV